MNVKWLRSQKIAEEERVAADKPIKTAAAHYIRFISKRGSYNTITFSDVDLMPRIFSSQKESNEYGDDDDSSE